MHRLAVRQVGGVHIGELRATDCERDPFPHEREVHRVDLERPGAGVSAVVLRRDVMSHPNSWAEK